jgi:Reverse transcriptase-like
MHTRQGRAEVRTFLPEQDSAVAGEAFALVDASIDQSGKAGAGMAFFTSTGQLQVVHFLPIQAETVFHAEAEALLVALRDWNSSYMKKSKQIYIDYQALVIFLAHGREEEIPC